VYKDSSAVPTDNVHTNLELKARIPSLEAAAATAHHCGARFQGVLVQRDTYLRVLHGRLKIREIQDVGAELIYYIRDDSTGVKTSRYMKDPIQNVEVLKSILFQSLGILAIVNKRRHLFLYENARIHIDDVAGLGSFVEFEIVDGGQKPSETLMQLLCHTFVISDPNIVKASYSDLILAETAENST
jgi:predicted adenylyl cyclase CyaB